MATHLLETVRKHADEILTRDATQHLLDELKKNSPAVVDEVMSILNLGQIQRVLQQLLREQIPIRQLDAILEAIGNHGTTTKDAIWLADFARMRLARTICTKYRDENNVLNVVLFDPALEDQIRAGFEANESGWFIRLSPNAKENLCHKILQELEKLTQMNLPPIVLVNPQIRAALKQITSATIPGLIVLSYNEVTRDTQVVGVGVVTP